MTTIWRIELMGGLRIQRLSVVDSQEPQEDAAPVVHRFRSRQAGALLAFLAFYERPHARETLAEMLWPEHDPAKSRNHLRVVLSSLRAELEPDGTARGSVIETDRNFVKLNFELVTTDVREFQSVLENAAQTGDSRAQHALLVRAVELYGGALLPGIYEEWVVPEAHRLEERFFAALRRVVADLKDDPHRAIEFARRGASVDPLREECARDLMRLYAATGQPALARRQFHELENSLARTQNAAPSSQTRELLRGIEREALQTQDQQFAAPPAHSLKEAVIVPPPLDSTSSPAPLDASQAPIAPDLPPQWTRFFGRESEIARAKHWLENGARLITFTGTGGAGKTRLALEIARRLAQENPDRALWFVALADVADARLLAGEVADVLRLPRGSSSLTCAHVIGALRARPAPFLVLDNFEQLVPDGCALVQEVLSHVPQLHLLVTSRHELGIVGEQVLPVPALEVPRDDLSFETLMHIESVQMFHDRAKGARPDFRLSRHNAPAIARLCARLEGLPLAIELCAARAATHSPSKMLARLERRFEFLGEQTPASTHRHSTLRAALEWSFALLWPELREFFVQLSAFRGGCTARAAASVTQQPHAAHFLEQLRAMSLVVRDEVSVEARFRLLETVREFALEKLSPEQEDELRRRHAQFYHTVVDEEHPHIMAAHAGRRIESMARVEAEHENLRAAMTWSVEHDPELGLRLVHLISPFWGGAGREAHSLAERALEQVPDAPPGLVSAMLGIAATQADWNGDHARQHALLERRLNLMLAHNNELDMAWSLFHLGCAFHGSGDLAKATEHFAQALSTFRAWQHEGPQELQNVAWTLDKLGECAVCCGDLDTATSHFEECAATFERGEDRDGVASALSQLGDVARRRGNFEDAQRLFAQSDQLQGELGDVRAHPWRRLQRARLKWDEGDLAGARHEFARALQDFSTDGVREGMLRSLGALGCVAMAQGDAKHALLLLGFGAAQHEEGGSFVWPCERAAQQRAIQQARAELGKEFEAFFAKGRALELEAAIAWALKGESVDL